MAQDQKTQPNPVKANILTGTKFANGGKLTKQSFQRDLDSKEAMVNNFSRDQLEVLGSEAMPKNKTELN